MVHRLFSVYAARMAPNVRGEAGSAAERLRPCREVGLLVLCSRSTFPRGNTCNRCSGPHDLKSPQDAVRFSEPHYLYLAIDAVRVAPHPVAL